MQKAKTQRDDRMTHVGPDQFGRLWTYRVELSTLQLTGDIHSSGWERSDPLGTPTKYFRLPDGYAGRPDFSRIVVDFDRWIQDQTRALVDWVNWLWSVGQQLNPGAKSIYDIEKDPRCLAHAGDKPWPSVEILELAKAGSPELLGMKPMSAETEKLMCRISVSTVLQESLARFSPDQQAQLQTLRDAVPAKEVGGEPATSYVDPATLDTWPKFLAHHRASGKTIQEVSALWRGQKPQPVAA